MERKTVVSPSQNVTGSVNHITVLTSIDITATGNYNDQSQRNWDSIITVISMRSQPVILSEPKYVESLEEYGSSTLTGYGYVFHFTVEHNEIFAEHDADLNIIDPFKKLKEIVDGIMLGEDEVKTFDDNNIEFIYREF